MTATTTATATTIATTTTASWAGVDVSKRWLDVQVDGGVSFRVGNDPQGHAVLLEKLTSGAWLVW